MTTPAAAPRVLLVAPHFAPVNAPDGHRVRQCLPYCSAFGWEAEVLCVRPEDVAASQDPQLTAQLPAQVPIWRCHAWPLSLTRWLGLRTLGWRAVGGLRRAGSQLLRTRRFDLVYFSTTQWPALLAGPYWYRRFGVPYVVDLQDPLATDYYERAGAPPPPGGWKYALSRRLARWLEQRCFPSAAGFVSVSPDYLHDLSARYPWFAARPQATIPFGADEREWEYARALASTGAPPAREGGCLQLTYVGAAGPIMEPAFTLLFRALARLREQQPQLFARLRVHFIGTSYAPGGKAEAFALALARRYGVEAIVREQTTRIGYYAALSTLDATDVVLLLGSADRAYAPSKIANLAHARRPILALLPPGSQAESPLRACGIAHVFHSSPIDDVDRLCSWLTALPRCLPPHAPAPQADPAFLEHYHARTLTARHVELFNSILTATSGSRRTTRPDSAAGAPC